MSTPAMFLRRAPHLRAAALRVRPSTTASRIVSRRAAFGSSATERPRARENLNINKLSESSRDYDRDRTVFLAAGAVAGIVSFIYTAWKLKKAFDRKNASSDDSGTAQLDSSTPTSTFTTEAGTKRKVVVHDENGNELVPTGHKVVPTFPRTITLPSSRPGEPPAEYTLVGHGLRTVSFLSIHVYLVGFYIATADIATLQKYLVKKVNHLATTLVSSEKDDLRNILRDATAGEETWDTLLREAGCRTAFRVVPVRDTDFHHLRDGFMRAIAARSQVDPKSYKDQEFGAALRDFKNTFNRGKAPREKELLLARDDRGKLTVMYDAGKSTGLETIGSVEDERVSRLLWLNYLAGQKVASEMARENIIHGIMEFVERPIGTVAAQVV